MSDSTESMSQDVTCSTTTVVCISDTHNYAPRGALPPGDVLIHAGDWTSTGLAVQIDAFLRWFSAQPHATKICVAGNHETTMDAPFYAQHWRNFHGKRQNTEQIRDHVARLAPGVIYLNDTSVTLPSGLTVYGSPRTPEFCNWAFGYEHDEDVWAGIPDGTDILVTHGPPLGILDACEDGRHVGCPHLARHVLERVRPQLHVFGHIHHSYGTTSVGGTQFVNAAMCTERYHPDNPPVVVTVVPVTASARGVAGGGAGDSRPSAGAVNPVA